MTAGQSIPLTLFETVRNLPLTKKFVKRTEPKQQRIFPALENFNYTLSRPKLSVFIYFYPNYTCTSVGYTRQKNS